MSNERTPRLRLPALDPDGVPAREGSGYPTEAMRDAVAGRSRQVLGNPLGLQNYGVNRVRLAPGACSALRHWHSRQDEFIYVLEGELTLITDREGEQRLGPGDCAGFPAGVANGHQLVNRGGVAVVYLEVGDRLPGDRAHYSEDDLAAEASPPSYRFTRRDGTPY